MIIHTPEVSYKKIDIVEGVWSPKIAKVVAQNKYNKFNRKRKMVQEVEIINIEPYGN